MNRITFVVMRHLIRPRVFLLGIICGLLICSLVGRKIADIGYYQDFIRICGSHSTCPSFIVTASQISALIKKTCHKDQTLVLVGGSSVLMGAGQPIRYLWTKKLQEKLGCDYCVYNLATPAGGLVGYASVAFELLSNQFKSAILVSDSQLPPVDPDGMLWYKHFFWDAYYKGMLKNSPVKYSKAQIERMKIENPNRLEKAILRNKQVRLGMRLDSYFYFNDFWTYIHYAFIQSVYDPLSGPNWSMPRRSHVDYDYEIDEQQIKTLSHYPQPGSGLFESEFAVVSAFRSRGFKKTSSGYAVDEEGMKRLDLLLKDYPLTRVSNNIIIPIIGESPFYVNKLSEIDQRDYYHMWQRMSDLWINHGYRAFIVTGLGPDDYGDRPHLNTLGGWKLADQVADQIMIIRKTQK